MNIKPVTNGTGIPSASLDVGGPNHSAKIAAAKAIMAGEKPIRVEPSDAPTDPQVQRAEASIRKIKMKTQVSPDRAFTQSVQNPAPAEEAQPNPNDILDTNESTTRAQEATKPLSPQFAALARQKRALQVKERELAQREQAIKSQPQNESVRDVLAEIKANPLSILQEAGVSYQQLTEAVLANNSNPELAALRAEVKALKDGVDNQFKSNADLQKTEALNMMRKEAVLLSREGDDYALVRETGSIPDVIELIDRTYSKTGEVLDVPEALKSVEDYLYKKSLQIAKLKKVQSGLTPAQAQQQQQQQQQSTMRTLTNRDGVLPPMSRRDRAIAAANGTLKKG